MTCVFMGKNLHVQAKIWKCDQLFLYAYFLVDKSLTTIHLKWDWNKTACYLPWSTQCLWVHRVASLSLLGNHIDSKFLDQTDSDSVNE